MITYRNSQGLLVVTQAEGSLVGKLDDYQFDLESHRIYGYRIKGTGVFRRGGGVPAAALLKVGKDVVFVHSELDISWQGSSRNSESGRAWASQYRGRKVMSRSGTALGSVEDFVFDPVEDRVLALIISNDSFVELGEDVATGPAAVILRDESQLQPLPKDDKSSSDWWSRWFQRDTPAEIAPTAEDAEAGEE